MVYETGALTNELTRKALRDWFRSIMFRAVLGVVIVNGGDAILLRLRPPLVIAIFLVVVVAIGLFTVLNQVLQYLHLVKVRYILSKAEWSKATGMVRPVFVGPVRVGYFGVMTSEFDDYVLARRATPKMFAQRMPAELEENNLVVVARGRRHVYSVPDGSTPVLTKRSRNKPLAALLRDAVVGQS